MLMMAMTMVGHERKARVGHRLGHGLRHGMAGICLPICLDQYWILICDTTALMTAFMTDPFCVLLTSE
jgi:hypothetical protein